jgi:hypothetical protein
VRCEELQVLLRQDRLPVDATHSLLELQWEQCQLLKLATMLIVLFNPNLNLFLYVYIHVQVYNMYLWLEFEM